MLFIQHPTPLILIRVLLLFVPHFSLSFSHFVAATSLLHSSESALLVSLSPDTVNPGEFQLHPSLADHHLCHLFIIANHIQCYITVVLFAQSQGVFYIHRSECYITVCLVFAQSQGVLYIPVRFGQSQAVLYLCHNCHLLANHRQSYMYHKIKLVWQFHDIVYKSGIMGWCVSGRCGPLLKRLCLYIQGCLEAHGAIFWIHIDLFSDIWCSSKTFYCLGKCGLLKVGVGMGEG